MLSGKYLRYTPAHAYNTTILCHLGLYKIPLWSEAESSSTPIPCALLPPRCEIRANPGMQGCDDILALLMALASSAEDIEILLISVTYGNVDTQK